MKNKIITMISILVFGMASFAMISPAHAEIETVQGEITEIDTYNRTLMVARSDPSSGAAEPEAVKVLLSPAVTFSGVAGLDELRVGDEIFLDVESDVQTGNLTASGVRIDKVNIRS